MCWVDFDKPTSDELVTTRLATACPQHPPLAMPLALLQAVVL